MCVKKSHPLSAKKKKKERKKERKMFKIKDEITVTNTAVEDIVLVTSQSRIKLEAARAVFPLCTVVGLNECNFYTDDQPFGIKSIYDNCEKRFPKKGLNNIVDSAFMVVSMENGLIENNISKKTKYKDVAMALVESPALEIVKGTKCSNYSTVGFNDEWAIDVPDSLTDGLTANGITWGKRLFNLTGDYRDEKDPHSTILNKPDSRLYLLTEILHDSVVNYCAPFYAIHNEVKFWSYDHVFENRHLSRCLYQYIFKVLGDIEFDIVVGIESRGFDIAATIAHMAEKGFARIRKAGKLPLTKPLFSAYCRTEYDTLDKQIQMYGLKPGTKVLLVDDILATGSTFHASKRLIKAAGGDLVSGFVLAKLDYVEKVKELDDTNIKYIHEIY